MLSRPMLMNVNNTFGNCPNKTDVLTVFLLGIQLDIMHVTCLFWLWMAVISEYSLYSPPSRSYILNSLKFLCRAVWNYSRCIWYSAWVLLFLCVMVSTQCVRAVAFSPCLTKTGFSHCVKINVETGTKPRTNS